MKDICAEKIIEDLDLKKHPEGGWYCETYRSDAVIDTERGERNLATAIYFMLKGTEKSAFHRLSSDEFWYFHQGSVLDVHIIECDGSYSLKKLGPAGNGESIPQLLLPAGCWFAAQCVDKDSFSLVSCSVHPGFDFKDFELAAAKELTALYPEYSEVISDFCLN